MATPYRRADAALLVLLALVGTWFGHNAVYLALNGGGVVQQLTSPVHIYMIPVGAALLGLAGLFGMVWARALARLRLRLTALQHAVRGGGRGPTSEPAVAVSRSVDLIGVWLTLAGLQLLLYIGQENLEARAVHAPLRGLAVVAGTHWVALPVHALLALGLAALTVSGRRQTVRLQRAVRACARLFAQLHRRPSLADPVASRPVPTLTPMQRWGASLWQRPPPFAAA